MWRDGWGLVLVLSFLPFVASAEINEDDLRESLRTHAGQRPSMGALVDWMLEFQEHNPLAFGIFKDALPTAADRSTPADFAMTWKKVDRIMGNQAETMRLLLPKTLLALRRAGPSESKAKLVSALLASFSRIPEPKAELARELRMQLWESQALGSANFDLSRSPSLWAPVMSRSEEVFGRDLSFSPISVETTIDRLLFAAEESSDLSSLLSRLLAHSDPSSILRLKKEIFRRGRDPEKSERALQRLYPSLMMSAERSLKHGESGETGALEEGLKIYGFLYKHWASLAEEQQRAFAFDVMQRSSRDDAFERHVLGRAGDQVSSRSQFLATGLGVVLEAEFQGGARQATAKIPELERLVDLAEKLPPHSPLRQALVSRYLAPSAMIAGMDRVHAQAERILLLASGNPVLEQDYLHKIFPSLMSFLQTSRSGLRATANRPEIPLRPYHFETLLDRLHLLAPDQQHAVAMELKPSWLAQVYLSLDPRASREGDILSFRERVEDHPNWRLISDDVWGSRAEPDGASSLLERWRRSRFARALVLECLGSAPVIRVQPQ